MTRRVLPIDCLVTALLLLPVACPCAPAGEPRANASPATLDEIAEAWRERQTRIHSGEFEWEEVRITSRSAADLELGPFDPPPGTEPKGTVTDREPYRHEYRRSLLFEGEKTRFWSAEPILTPKRTHYVDHELTEAFDGRLCRILRDHDFGDSRTFRYQGSVLPADQQQTHFLVDLKALFLHFRAFRLNESFPDRFRLAGRGVVDDAPCVILERVENPQRRVVESFWVDPRQAFCVRRNVRRAGDVVRRQIDVEYDVDPALGPVPKAWKLLEHFANGELDRSIEATITKARLNHDVADERFDIEFPVGTFVYDATQSSGGEAARYIVRPKGTKRDVLPAEHARAKTAEDLLETETGMAGIERPRRSALMTLWAIGIFSAVAAIMVWLSIRRMRAS
jgi:hypothetical protein